MSPTRSAVGSGDPEQPLALIAQRQHGTELHRALNERSPLLAEIYAGSVYALADETNPEYFSHAAHSLRELMDKLPSIVEVPTPAAHESLKVKTVELATRWKTAHSKSAAQTGSVWSGPIDGHLRRLLNDLGTFVEWFEAHFPRRRAERGAYLECVDAGPSWQAQPPRGVVRSRRRRRLA